RQAAGLVRRREPAVAGGAVHRLVEGREVQLLLAAEEALEAAVAHRALAGEPADGEPLEAVDRCALDCGVEHLGACAGNCRGAAARHLVVHVTVRTIVRYMYCAEVAMQTRWLGWAGVEVEADGVT